MKIKWNKIDCLKNLPPKNVPVLLCNKDENWMNIGIFDGFNGKRGKNRLAIFLTECGECDFLDNTELTHWAELPDFPEK